MPGRPANSLRRRAVALLLGLPGLLLILIAAAGLIAPPSAGAVEVDRELIVRLRPGSNAVGPGAASPVIGRLDDLLADLDPAWRPAFAARQNPPDRTGAASASGGPRRVPFLDQIRVLRFGDSRARDVALERLARHPEVLYVEPLRTIEVEDGHGRPPGAAASSVSAAAGMLGAGWSASVVPGDSLYVEQWALPLIGMPEVWEGGTGTPGIMVAVVDTGIETEHPDLAPNLARNPAELAGLLGVDDDDNGYVDDVLGWNVLDQNRDVEDGYGHGSHIAGIIGAASDGVYGTVGVTWEVELLAVRMFDDSGSGTNLAGAQGIVYAADRGADIINMSWGTRQLSPVIGDAVTYAAATGAVLVASAGNSSNRVIDNFPAAHDEVIAVGATTDGDYLAGFSNRGVAIDLVAPGTLILGPQRGGHQLNSGTSQSAAVVSGVLAHLRYRHPKLGAEELRSVLRHTAVDLGREGWDPAFGAGRIDAAHALADPAAPVAAILQPRTQAATAAPGIAVIADAKPASGMSGVADFTLDLGVGEDPLSFELVSTGTSGPSRQIGVLDLAGRPEGEITVRLRVRDASGIEAEDRVLLAIDRSAPALINREHADRLSGRRFQQLIRYAANERVTGQIFLREAGSDQEFEVIRSDEGYTEHSANLTGRYPGRYEYLIEVTDLAGHRTRVDSGDGAPLTRLVLPEIEIPSHQFVPLQRIEGFELGVVFDLDGRGGPELLGERREPGAASGRMTVLGFSPGWPEAGVLETRYEGPPGLPTAVNDVDGDGDPEVLVADDDLSLMTGVLSTEPRLLWSSGEGNRRSGGSLVDLDGDRSAELLFPTAERARLTLFKWRGGSFEEIDLGFTRSTRTAHFAIADYDGDGRIEIALGSLAGEFVVLEARGGDFVETTREPFFGRVANAITAAHLGDADGDGRPEFAVAAVGAILNREQRPTLGIFEADGDDRYKVAGRFEFTSKNIPYDNALAAGDVDGDGDPELALAYAGHVYLFDSDRDDRYLPSWCLPRTGGGRVMVVDLDGDGMAEILVAERTAEGPVTTVYGRASAPPPAAISWQAILHPLGNEIRWQVNGSGARVFDLALYRLEAAEVPGIESDLESRRIHQHPGELTGGELFRDAERPPGPTRYLLAYTALADDAGGGEIRWRVLEGPVAAGPVAGVPALLLSAPYPNPARGPVTLPLALAGPGPVAVTIYDVSGRAQRQLWCGPLPAGPHRLAWDGRDDQGRRVASGIYFVGARSPLGETSARLVLLWR